MDVRTSRSCWAGMVAGRRLAAGHRLVVAGSVLGSGSLSTLKDLFSDYVESGFMGYLNEPKNLVLCVK